MDVGSPEWIEASLARLDELEQERATHEAALETVKEPFTLRQHNEAIEQLSVEIKSLYAQLEAVAEEDEDDADADADSPPTPTQGDDELSAPHISAMTGDDPGGAGFSAPVSAPPPSAAADNPFASPAAGADFAASATSSYDDDLKPKGGGSKWVFLLVVLLGAGGVGGYFVWQNMQAQKNAAPAAPAGPEEVIKAAEIRDDTEEPNAAQGGEATISPNANPRSNNGGSGGSGGGGKSKKEEKKTKPIVLKGGDGPL
ncbi:hypothetical protein DB30_02050 [Enhygromyxa salina]|uniref:Uncharacterized protein n=1 Tax=Enhygromyxa salina TaxID=215803 RepID=A0A0C2CLF1_9BACT|nr:hypothetical protein [Enhygromyxa salina]KIG12076.1 hypothetical protein DB30_02050 [Enhygromyxa salina]